MNYRLLLATIAVLIVGLPGFAQDDSYIIPEYAKGTPIPEAMFYPTTPDVQEMIKYGNATANLYTGAATYTINLYTYSDNVFNIPIVISYNGSGYRPSRYSGVVGTGWSLNVGGVITREIRGLPDEATSRSYTDKNSGDGHIDDVYAVAGALGYGHSALKQMLYNYYRRNTVLVFGYGAKTASTAPLSDIDFAYSGEIGKEYIMFKKEINETNSPRNFELESDLYHFYFMGHSGTFILGENKDCIILNSNSPAGELKIKYHYNSSSPLKTYFTISTGDGMHYSFECSDTCTASCDWGVNGSSADDEDCISCWKLTEIRALNGMTANFLYSMPNYNATIGTENNAICIDNLTVTDVSGNRQKSWIGSGECKIGTITNYVTSSRLCKIVIPGRVNITFSYDSSNLLSGLNVTNMFAKSVASCSLYYNSIKNQHLLSSLSLSGEGDYFMRYYGENEDIDIPMLSNWKEDWYGFYSSTIQIPEFRGGKLKQYSEQLITSKNTFNFEDTRLFMLKRLSYPTGGYSDYIYEQNSYTSKPGRIESIPETLTGGIRVSRIDTYDIDSVLVSSKRYSYKTKTGKCSGILYKEPHIYYKYRLSAPILTIEREVVSSMSGNENNQDEHIGYSRVLEEISDTIGGVPQSITEHIFNSQDNGAYEEVYHSSTYDYITKEGNNFQFEDMGSDFVSSQLKNGSLVGGWELARSISTSSNKILETAQSIAYWHPSSNDSIIVIPSIFHGRVYNRTHKRLSPYIRKISETHYGTNNASMSAKIRQISKMNNNGRANEYTTLDSREQSVVTSMTFRDDYPAFLTGKIITIGNKTTFAEQYNYSYFHTTNKVDSFLYPSVIKRGLINSNGDITGYETILSVLSYDNYGNPTKVADVFGNIAEYKWGYSGLHLIQKTIDIGNHRLRWYWTWSPLIGITSAILPDLSESIYGYDNFGRLTSVIESGNVIGKYEYNIINRN